MAVRHTDLDTGLLIDAPEQPPAHVSPTMSQNRRALGLVAVVVVALVGAFQLGRSAGPAVERARAPAQAAAAPLAATAVPTPMPTPSPVPTPGLTDLLGEGSVVAEIDFGNRSRVAIWCRETVPGTSIGSTLALLHFAESLQFGEQLIRYEELTKPWIPQGGRRGTVLETEGLGASNFAQPGDDNENETGGVTQGETDGSYCERCAPQRVDLGGEQVLIGSCQHGIPFRASIAYVIARPILAGQTPLAIHARCGITTIESQGSQLRIDAEAPLLRGLHDARFPFPSIMLVRDRGWLRADDLELFDWNCDVGRSSQLEDRHLLRAEPERRMSFETVDSLIGEIGLRGPVAIGLHPDQCSELTRAWWGRPPEEQGTGRPIADLLGIEPPEGEIDWFYTCQPQ